MHLYRIMCIDHGETRIGIALSDPLQIISRPYKVISNTNDNTLAEIKKIIEKENVGKIVVGLPVNFEGEDTIRTGEVREFVERLKKKISIPVIFWDERYSTVEANEILKKKKYSIKESKSVIDKVAASIILRDYLDSIK
ncbi:MAG: Holliday junction resolvase RuvX [Candidatus Cloacimonetes bacterium]|nr:Holliday junction resolvase RuvX [Candidatus Cloacimonadota bacterium]